ncbi:universal stress protein [Yoonia sp.]|uniref:universal stress protein n=1 Tax=Yoonia sp. TaxID=2212373 RepID=UPI0025E473CF|nr:universal stress protein [Yoonia sp.]
MSSATASAPMSTTPEPSCTNHDNRPPADLLVCIDENQLCAGVIPHALTMATAFGGKVVLLHVVESAKPRAANHLDPVDWEIRRREARARLSDLAQHYQTSDSEIEICILEGHATDQICARASEKAGDITVISGQHDDGRHDTDTAQHIYASNVARRVIEADIGSVLMVPRSAFAQTPQTYSQILVPLDGSSIAESALPKAVRLAKAQKATLTICHVTAQPDMPQIGPPDDEVDRLQGRLMQRARQVGRHYLNTVKDALHDCGISVKTAIVEGDDVRRALIETVNRRNVDLLVMASHGQSGYTDVPSGHVTSYVLDHAQVPVLMVRQQHRTNGSHIVTDAKSKGVRPPSNAIQ